MEEVRMFVAVPVAGEVAVEAGRVISELGSMGASVKWVDSHNLHITLKFLGDMPRAEIPALVDAVRQGISDGAGFDIEFRGVGAFPNMERPRVIWIGVSQGAAELARIARAIDASTCAAGFARADKAFRPHLTIGRARGELAAGDMAAAISSCADRRFGVVHAGAVHVFSSTLTPAGPIYRSLAEAPLR